MPTPTPGGQLADLVSAFANPLLQIVAHLAKSPNFGVLDLLQLSDMHECDFPGYAPVRLQPTILDPVDEVGYGMMDPVVVEFVAGAVVAEQQVTALFITAQEAPDAPVLRAVSFFDPPLTISRAGQIIQQEIAVEGLVID